MSNPILVAPSILCADFSRLVDEIAKCDRAGADMIHIDVMDGHFVPVITIGPLLVKAIRPLTRLPIEAHLMVDHPGDHIDQFIDAGADIISIHAECYGPRRPACREYGQYPKEVDTIDAVAMKKDIDRIKARGKKIYVVLNPGTPVCIGDVLPLIDGVLVMAVNPGFSHQSFMPSVLPKVAALRNVFAGDIAIDGGIKADTAMQSVAAGATVLVTASYFFGSKDQKEVVHYLRSLGQ